MLIWGDQMGYRVDYEPANRAFRSGKTRQLRLPLLSVAFFAVFLLLVRFCWPSGMDALRAALFWGDWQAIETFAENLREGHSLQFCTEAFCSEIIREATIDLR